MKLKLKDNKIESVKINSFGTQTIKVNVFDPDRLKDLALIKNHVGKYKLKIYKIAIIFAIILLPMSTFASGIDKQNIIRLSNTDRIAANSYVLSENSQLDVAAQNKANDMIAKQYFEHNTPDGKTPWNFIDAADYGYLYAGENLAMDFKTAEGVERAWMVSSSHRKNILNTKYTDIGIGIASGEFDGHFTTIVCQMFGTPSQTVSQSYSGFIAQVSNLLGARK